MARFCVQDGISHIVATPHYHSYTRVVRAEILRHVRRLNEALAEAAVALTILPGSEVQVTDTSEYRRDFEAGLFCHLGDGRAFTLVEFGWQDELPPEAPGLIEWLRGRGVTPIVAHPERHRYFVQDPVRLRTLVGRDSIAGLGGRAAAELLGCGPSDRRPQSRALLGAVGRVCLGSGQAGSEQIRGFGGARGSGVVGTAEPWLTRLPKRESLSRAPAARGDPQPQLSTESWQLQVWRDQRSLLITSLPAP